MPDHTATQPKLSSIKEFTILIALLMSIIALSIDAMLPALGTIAHDLQVTNTNHVQYIISAIFLGMTIGELVCGPLSDALGRKKILFMGIGLYLIGSIICFLSPSFEILLFGRFIQGLGVSGPYVSATSIVRDKYSGRDMARVMSVAMMIFMTIPAIAPGLGQTILLFWSWRSIFLLYISYSVIIGLWLAFRLEETLPLSQRIPFKMKDIVAGFYEVIGNRMTMGYMLCMGICFGSFLGYLNSAQQIFQVQFQTGKMFTVYFGILALVLGLAFMINARFVERLGMRYLCARSMQCIIAASALFLIIHVFFAIHLWMFLTYAAILFFSFGLMFGNLNSIAMEPMGHVAGIASAVIGAVSTAISMVIGAIIGQLYNNTLVPIVTGFLILSIMSLWVMKYADGKKHAVS